MDVNGTRFHEILGSADWARCTADGGATLSSEATLQPLLFRLPPISAPPDPAALRRGAAADRYGNWYWVDAAQEHVLVQSSGTGTASRFWPLEAQPQTPPAGGFGPAEPEPPDEPRHLGGLAVTADHHLVVGTLDRPGLLIFDLHAGGPPRRLRWPGPVPFAPFDLAALSTPAADGSAVFVLDRENRRFWSFDRHLRVLQPPGPTPPPESFAPDSGAPDDLRPPAISFPPGVDLSAAASPIAAVDPVALEPLPDGSVLILDRGFVHRYRGAQHLATVALDLSSVTPSPVSFGADLAVVGSRLYVTAADGAQAYAFTVDFEETTLTLQPAGAPFLPMNLFGGRGLVSAAGNAWYDVGDRGWVRLVEQKRPRYELEGAVETPVFDGREPACVWHRLFFEGCVPPQAAVQVFSRTAEDPRDLPRVPWVAEPAPRLRPDGPELPLLRSDSAGVFELLFQRARGRYLQLRLVLRGDGRTSPRLRALRIWYPRFSYLDRYLPAVYREDPDSASFLDRFLANLEGLFTGVEDRMAVAQALLDARTAPPDALEWLAGWFGVALDPAWSEAQRRLFLRHAMQFFQMRGTVRGLQAALRLALEPCADESVFSAPAVDAPQSVRILEWFRLRNLPALALGDPSGLSGIRAVSATGAWTLEQGGAALRDRWQEAALAAGFTVGEVPLSAPDDPQLAPVWRSFAATTLGFAPTRGAREQQAFRDFLARRYRRAAALNAAYGTSFSGFDAVPLPAVLPKDGAPLRDWVQFFSVAQAISARAHRFTVLLPVPSREAFAIALHQQRRDLTQRIVELEKPAHTRFDVKFYWAMFRVGEARTGIDTLLDQGSRAPELMPALLLGRGFLAESHLQGTPEERDLERAVVGQRPLGRRPEENRS